MQPECQKRPTIVSKETYYCVKRDLLGSCMRCSQTIIEVPRGARGASRRRMRVAWTFSKEKDIFKSQCPSVFPVDKIEKIKIENFILFIILCVSVCVSEWVYVYIKTKITTPGKNPLFTWSGPRRGRGWKIQMWYHRRGGICKGRRHLLIAAGSVCKATIVLKQARKKSLATFWAASKPPRAARKPTATGGTKKIV